MPSPDEPSHGQIAVESRLLATLERAALPITEAQLVYEAKVDDGTARVVLSWLLGERKVVAEAQGNHVVYRLPRDDTAAS